MRRPPASLFADLLGCRDPLALVSAPFRPAAARRRRHRIHLQASKN